MASKKKKMTLDKLADLVTRGFAKNDKRFEKIESKLDSVLEQTAALTEDMTVVKSIVTNNTDHLVSIESEIKGIRADAVVANRRITTLETRPLALPPNQPTNSRSE